MSDAEWNWSKFDLVWGVKDSFIHYVRDLPDGLIAPFGSAQTIPSAVTDEWLFPYAGNEADGTGVRIRFEGELRIRAHHGMLLVILMNPWLTFTETGVVLSVVDLVAWPDTTKRQVLATGPSVSPGPENTEVSVALSLTEEAVDLFNGVYAPGTALAPARLVVRPGQ